MPWNDAARVSSAKPSKRSLRRPKRRQRRRLHAELLEDRRLLAAEISLVSDINPGSGDSIIADLVRVGSDLYFNADDSSGSSIWRHRPATGTTEKLLDPASGVPVQGTDLAAFSEGLVFGGTGGNDGLYQYDPVADSVSQLSTIYTGGATVVGDTIFFAADDGNLGVELWRYELSAGTSLAADIDPSPDGSWPYEIMEHNDQLYFWSSYDLSTGQPTAFAFYQFDPSTDSVSQLLPADTGGAGGSIQTNEYDVVGVGANIYLPMTNIESTEIDDAELASLPGPNYINVNALDENDFSSWSSPVSSFASDLTAVGDSLYFTATQAFPVYEGTDLNGNVVVTNEFGEYLDSEGNLQTAFDLNVVGDYEYLGIVELDPSDNSFQTIVGQVAGPDEFPDVRPFSGANMWSGDGKLYFRGEDATGIGGLWTFDPVTRQTERILSDATDPVVTLEVSPVAIGSSVYLVAGSASTGRELHLLSEPTAPVANAGGPYVADEGTPITLDASGTTDAGTPLGALQFQWDLNYDGTTFDVDATGVSPSVDFGNELTGQAIALRVTDPTGLTSLAETTIDVRNLPPVITSLPDMTAQAGQAITFTSTVSDPGAGDTLTYTWDFGQGDPQTGVDLASPTHTYSTPGTFQGLLTVTDDAGESVQQTFSVVVAEPVSFAIASQTIDEADGSVTAMLTLDSPAASNITIPYTVSGTADGADHDLVDGSVVIATGESSAEIVVQITDDQLDEVDIETLVISLGTPTGASLGNNTTHEISIADNDAKPLAFLSTPFVRLEEDFGVSTNITVQLDAASGRDVTVPIVFAGSATLNADYTVDSTSVVIPAGSQSASVTVSLTNDVDPEPAETIQFSLGSSNEATVVASQGLPASGTITIAQNDEPQVWFDRLAFTRTEGDGLPLTSGPTILVSKPSTSAITVPFTVTGAGDDIAVGPASGTVTIPAGGTHGVLQYGVIDDGIAESVTEVTITLGQPTGASLGPVTTSTLTILDDDVPTATLTSTAPPSVFESFGQIPISVQLDRVADRDVTFELRLSRGNESRVAVEGIDYVLEDGPLQITQGQAKVDRTITLIDDDSHEQTERLTVTLIRPYGTRADGTPYVQPGDQTSLTFELRDNDPLIALALSESSVDESDTTVVFEASLIGDTEQPIDLSFTVSGTATPGADFVDPINNVFSLDGSASYSGMIQILDDVFDEPTERLTLDFTSTIGQFRPLIGNLTGDSLSISISDDDAPPPTAWLRFDDSSVLENDGPFDLTVQLSSPAPEPLEVVVGLSDESGQPIIGSGFTDFSLSSATGSFDPATGTVTIPTGEDRFTLTVTPDGNSSFTGNRELHAGIISFSGAALGTLPVQAEFTNTSLYVYDDDPVIQLPTPTGTSIREDEGIVQFGVSVSGSHPDPISVDYVIQGSAAADFDYTGPTSGTLTVAPGSTELVTLNLINDAIPEGDEQIEVIFSSDFTFAQTWDGRTIDRISIGVRDDFDRTPEIDLKVLGTREATEGDTVAVQVRVSPPSPTPINLVAGVGLGAFGLVQPGGSGGFNLTDGSDDDGTYTIPANAGQLILNLPIPDDARNTGTKDLNIQILSAGTSSLADQGNPLGALRIDNSAASEQIRVRDNDAPSTVPDVNIGPPIDSDRFTNGQILLSIPSSQPQSPGTSPDLVIGSDGLSDAQPGTLPLPIGVSNGFISGGTVFFDANFNGVADYLDVNANGLQDVGEPTEPIFTTDAEGNFSSSIDVAFDQTGDGAIDYTEGRWTIYGGTDASKSLPLLTPMTAAPGMYVINGVSTLVSKLIEQHGQTLQSAKARVAETFDLSAADLGFLDNVRAASVNDQEGNQAVVANAQIMDTVNLISRMYAALPGSPDVPYFSDIVFAEIASLIAFDGAGIDLADEATQTALIGSVGNETGFTFAAVDVDAAATVIAASNAAIQNELTGDTSDLLENVVRAQIVAQTDIATALEELAAGTTDAATITAAYTGNNLDTLIADTTPGTIIPPAIVVRHAAVEEGDEGTTNLIFQVDLIGEPTQSVTVDYATLDGTATVADSDYLATDGALTWLASDNSPRFISVTVNGDNAIELTEHFSLLLSNINGGVLRSDLAYGYIVSSELSPSVDEPIGSLQAATFQFVELQPANPTHRVASSLRSGFIEQPVDFNGDVYFIARAQGQNFDEDFSATGEVYTNNFSRLWKIDSETQQYSLVEEVTLTELESISKVNGNLLLGNRPSNLIGNAVGTGGRLDLYSWNGAGTQAVLIASDTSGGGRFENHRFFRKRDSGGLEPWVTNGEPGPFNTFRLIDGNPGPSDSFSGSFKFVDGDGYYFVLRTSNSVDGFRIYRTEATRDTTTEIVGHGHSLHAAARYNGLTYLLVDSYDYGYELWSTDGTPTNTQLVTEFGFADFESVTGIQVVNDRLLFVGERPANDHELYSFDGESISLLAELDGQDSVSPWIWSWRQVSSTQFVFEGYTPQSPSHPARRSLWITDGTRVLYEASDIDNLSGFTTSDGILFPEFDASGTKELVRLRRFDFTSEAFVEDNADIFGPSHPSENVYPDGKLYDSSNGFVYSALHNLGNRFSGHSNPLVLNAKPTAVLPASVTVAEGSVVQLNLSSSTALYPDYQTIEWDLDYQGGEFNADAVEVGSVEIFAPAGPATRFVALRISDTWGRESTAVSEISVINVPPQINGLLDQSLRFGSQLTASATVIDPGSQDTFSLSWDLGDGTVVTDVTSISHAYAEEGEYFASLTATDSDGDGGVTVQAFRVVVGPPVSVTASAMALAEGDAVTLTATLQAALSEDVVVPITYSGAAIPYLDFTEQGKVSPPTSIVIPAGQLSASVLIENVEDALNEDTEDLIVQVGVPSNASLASHEPIVLDLLDNDAPPTAFISSDPQLIDEQHLTFPLTVSLSDVSGKDVIVSLAGLGSAEAGSDYRLDNSVLIIPAGETSASTTVTILDDNVGESVEQLRFEIVTSQHAALLDSADYPASLTHVIAANDAPSVQFAAVLSAVSEADGLHAIELRLSNPSDSSVSVEYAIAGDAIAGQDYDLAFTNPIVFEPGETSKILQFGLMNDTAVESTESIEVEIGQVTGAYLGTTPAHMARVFDDESLFLSLTASHESVWENDTGFITVTANLTQDAPFPIEVPVSFGGSANLEDDFFVSETTITIPTGSRSAETLIVLALNDFDPEPDRQVFVRASEPSTATFQGPQSLTIEILDDDPVVSFNRLVRPPITEENYSSFFSSISPGFKSFGPPNIFRTTQDPTRTNVQSDVEVDEDEGRVLLTVYLDKPVNRDVTIPIGFRALTAGFGDFVGVEQITIEEGKLSANLSIPIQDDEIFEDNETFSVRLLNDPAIALDDDQAVRRIISIQDDESEPEPRIYLTSAPGIVSEQEEPELEIQVRLSRPADLPVSTTLTVSGDAFANSDYFIPGLRRDSAFLSFKPRWSLDLTFAPGETVAKIPIKILRDAGGVFEEPVEHIELAVEQSDGAKSSLSIPIFDQDSLLRGSSSSIPHEVKVGLDFQRFEPKFLDPSFLGSLYPRAVVFDGFASTSSLFLDANFNQVADFVDLNGNGVRDIGEPVEPSTQTRYDGGARPLDLSPFDLNENGKIDFDEGQLVARGGTDVSINNPLPVPLVAPGVYEFVSPLTTLVAAAMESQDLSIREAETQAFTSLDLYDRAYLRANLILLAGSGDEAAADAFRESVRLYSTVIQIASFVSAFHGNLTTDLAGRTVFQDLAEKIQQPGSLLDLNEPFVIDSVLRGTVQRTGTPIPDAGVLASVVSAIAEMNAQYDAVPSAASREFLEGIAKVQSVANVDAVATLSNLARAEITPAQLGFEFTSTALQSKIALREIGNVMAPQIVADDVTIAEGDNGSKIATFEVVLTHASNLPVRVDYFSQGRTAEEDVDFGSVSGSIFWAAGEASPKSIQVPIFADTDFESDEVFELVLRNPTNAAVLESIAFGGILNDDEAVITPLTTPTEPKSFRLEVTPSGLTLEENEITAFDGPLTSGTFEIRASPGVSNHLDVKVATGSVSPEEIRFVGTGPLDSITIDPRFAELVERIWTATDGGFFEIDGVKVAYENVGTVESSATASLNGLPQEPVISSQSVLLTGQPPVAFDVGIAISESWTVTRDGDEVTTASGSTLDFEFTQNGTYRLTYTASQEGRLPGVATYEVTLANNNPVIQPRDFVVSDPTTLLSSTAGTFDLFGQSVAIAGDRMIVGSPLDDSVSFNAGQAFVFDAEDLSTGAATLNSNTVAFGQSHFGNTMAASGRYAVIGAPLHNPGGIPESGSAFVFDLETNTLVSQLNAPNQAIQDTFGGAVAISGTHVVVGAYRDDVTSTDAGAVYVFDSADLTAAPIVLENPAPSATDQFGFSVAIDGNLVVVGASFEDADANNSGAVYVFDLSEPTSAPVTLTNPNPGANAFFGQYLAANGGQLAVYSRLDSAVGNAGTVYVYDLADVSASPLTIENPTPVAGDDFGTAMSLSGSLLAIGNRGNDSTGNNSGRVYVYDLNEPSSPIVTLDNPTPGDGDEFGFSIDLSQTKLIVGAHVDDTGSSNGGAAYVYDLSVLTNIETAVTQDASAFDVDLLQRAFDPDSPDTLSVDPASVTFTSVNPIGLSIGGGVLTVDPSVYAYLPEGQTEQVGFTYAITDSAGGSVTQTVSITVEGLNDAPIAVADLNATTENAPVTTDVLANDTDVDTSDTITLGFTGGIRMLNDASLPVSPDSKNITLDPASGLEWLDLSITNGQSYSDTASRLEIGGDLEGFRFATAAEIENLWSTFGFVPGFESGSNNPAITEAVSFLGNLSTNGLSELTVGYFDDAATGTDPERVGWARAFVVPGEPRWQADITPDIRSKTSTENGTGSYLVRLASPAARIASMKSDADGSLIPIGDATVTTSAGSITFDPGSNFDGLAVGQTATVVIEYILTEASTAPLTDIGSLTISVTGQNDTATIAGDGQVTVGEDVDVFTGALSVIDPDFNEALFAAQNAVERTYGKFSISATGHWTFDLNNSLTNPLEEGETRTESFVVESMDGTATQNIQITIVGGADTDTDGVDDAIEEVIGDGNADGVADSLQDNVASLPNAVTATNVTLAAVVGTTLLNVLASDPTLLDQQPPTDVELPIGLFQFTALVDVGAATAVRLYYDAAEPVNAIYKFGPINDGASEYYLFEEVYFGIDEAGNNYVELHLVDGGAGDADGIANGQIFDPVGLALIPGMGNDIVTTSEDQALTFDPTVNDVLANPISMDAVSSPSFGVTAINGDGTIRYQPNADYFGNDSFTYSVTDANGFTSTASVIVTVLPVNDTPTIHLTDATSDVQEGGLATATGTFGDVDPGAVLQLVASVGELQDHGDGTWSWSYSPADGPVDSQTVDVSVSDGLTAKTVNFSLNVNNVPVNFNAGGDVALIPADEGQFVRSGILFTDPGADEWSGTVDFGDGSGEQPLTIDAANRSFDLSHTYTSEGSFFVTVNLKDDDSDFVADSFDVSVILNQAPVANDDVIVINEDSGSLDITGILGSDDNGLLGNDSDLDGDSVSIVAIDDSAITRGILQFDAGKVTFDPHGDFETLARGEIASHSFTYTIADPSGELSTATATIEVVGENDAPILSLDRTTLTVSEGSIATNSGSFLDVDTSDGLSLQASVGEIVDQGDGTWSWSWNTQDGPTDSQTVTISTSDGMLSVSESFPLLVVNTPPQFTNLGTDAPSFQLASPDLIVSLFGSFSDSGAVDTHRIEVNWGDGSETEDIPVHQAVGSFTTEHTYASAGFFNVTVTLVDKDGGSVTQSTTAVVQGVGLVDGKLWVIGTDDRDHIDVKRRWRYDGSGRWWRLSNWYEAIEVDARFGRQWIHESYAKSDVSSIEIVTLDDRDNIDVGHGVDKPVQVDSGNGNDHIDIRSGTATVVAGAGHDKVKTNSGDDVIDGGEGNDKIWSSAGNDIVIDIAGDNDISTSSGDDSVTTGNGDDRVDLGSGDDIAWLGAGDDRADGGPGEDFIFGEAGDDRIDGGRGNDVIVGGDGDDRIDGDRGSDILIGGAGADRIDGGRDHDLLIAGWTVYDHDSSALGRIIDEWTNDLEFNEKIDNLRSGSGPHLVDEQLVVGLTVFDDNSKDRLDGDQARDWFFASLEDRLKRKRNKDMLDLFE